MAKQLARNPVVGERAYKQPFATFQGDPKKLRTYCDEERTAQVLAAEFLEVFQDSVTFLVGVGRRPRSR